MVPGPVALPALGHLLLMPILTPTLVKHAILGGKPRYPKGDPEVLGAV